MNLEILLKVGHLVTQSVPRSKALMRKASPAGRALIHRHRGLQVIFERALLGNRHVGGFGAEARFGNKPNGANIQCGKQIQGFR